MIRLGLIVLGLISFLAFPLHADQDSGAGTVISVVGEPKVSADQGTTFHGIKLGETLELGALIRTGLGKLSLLLTDGSTARLAQNTEMTLTGYNPDEDHGGTIFSLAKGFARFLVSKVKPGNHFEVHTSNAVAAVKGTDWEVGVDEGKTQVWVFPHDNLGKVELADLKQLEKILVGEGSYAAYDGSDFSHGKFNPKDSQNSDGRYDGLSSSKGDTGSGGTPKNSGTQANTGNNSNGVSDQIGQHMGEILSGIQNQIVQQHNANTQITSQMQSADLYMQRMVIDQSGTPDLVTQTYTRPSANTIDNVTVNQRQTGINAGTSSLIEITSFNGVLPYNWQSAFEAPVNMTLYRTTQETLMQNPLGNTYLTNAIFSAPVAQTSGPQFLQPVVQTFTFNGVLNATLIGTPNGNGIYNFSGSYQAYSDGAESDGSGISYGYEVNGPNGSFSISEVLSALGNGNLSTSQATVYSVSNASTNAPSAFWINRNSGNGGPSLVSQGIAGLPSSYNVEMEFGAGGVFQVDLVFLPGFFDTYDLGILQAGTITGG